MPPVLDFTVTHTDGGARRGVMQTAHGAVQTPAFMPVGTRGAVKGLTPRDLEGLGAEIILGNTYHLWLRPGDGVIGRLGGLHRFAAWPRPILTDSGGFQAYSLGDRRTITEEGVRFQSHLDGSPLLLTPEGAADIQAQLGSDIAMVLDECLAQPATQQAVQTSTALSARWARRGRDRFLAVSERAAASRPADGDPMVTNPGQAQFGIIQGGVYPALRALSVDLTRAIGFEAYAIGGLSVGEPPETMYAVVETTAPLLPAERPRYLMGVGTPADIAEAVARGVDLFDCVMPTRNARNGQLFTSEGRLAIKHARFAEDPGPLDPACACYTCRTFPRAYLRHLFVAGEITAAVLHTIHNVHYYLDTMSRIRQAIVFGSFESVRRSLHSTFSRQSCDP
jgi:queuine tRNA-ribosyltransferase